MGSYKWQFIPNGIECCIDVRVLLYVWDMIFCFSWCEMAEYLKPVLTFLFCLGSMT